MRGSQNDRQSKCHNLKPKNSVKLNSVLKSKMVLMVRQVHFPSHLQLNFILDGGLIHNSQILKFICFILRAAAILFDLTMGITNLV